MMCCSTTEGLQSYGSTSYCGGKTRNGGRGRRSYVRKQLYASKGHGNLEGTGFGFVNFVSEQSFPFT